MTDTPLLYLAAISSSQVEFRRGTGIPDDTWFGLVVRLDGELVKGDSKRVLVPVDRFLGGRAWLISHLRDAAVGIDLDEGVAVLLKRGRDEASALKGVLDGTFKAEVALDEARESRFSRVLREFQSRDLTRLRELPHGANFSVPGAGKTSVTLALYEAERIADRVDKLLVVSPLAAFEAWESESVACFTTLPEIDRFDGSIRNGCEILLVNYQKLRDPHLSLIMDWALAGRTHIVLDEAHRMKRGREGEWGRACLQLAFAGERRDILTGTPAPQGPSDFVALIDFLWPGQSRTVLPPSAFASNPLDGTTSAVADSIRSLFVRTNKSELGLDDPALHVEPVVMGPLQAEIYDALKNRYAGMFDLSRSDRTALAEMGEVLMYLLEAATNPALLADRPNGQSAIPFRFPSLEIPAGSQLAELVDGYHRHEIPAKFAKVLSLVDANAAEGKKTLVWTNFVGNLLSLERILAPFQPALAYGGIPAGRDDPEPGMRTRESELERFRTDPSCFVLLANPAAVGEGISLHMSCHDAIYVERTFNAGQYLQSLDRIHRLGLPPGTDTNVTFLEATGTIDERVNGRVKLKAERLSEMLSDPGLARMALPDEDDFGEMIEDVDDIDEVLAHLVGDD